jgi:hypothetical protein
MPDTAPIVEPNPAAAPVEQAPAEATATLPDDLLRIPAMQAVFAGQPPAVSASLADFSKRPEGKLIAKNKDGLLQAGMGLYRSLAGDLGVIFNQLYLPPEQLQEADKAGKLLDVAPPFDVVNQQVASSGEKNPVLNHPGVPQGLPKYNPPAATQPSAAVKPMSAKAESKVTTARAKASQLGAPTSGPNPGAGRILNSILKNPV